MIVPRPGRSVQLLDFNSKLKIRGEDCSIGDCAALAGSECTAWPPEGSPAGSNGEPWSVRVEFGDDRSPLSGSPLPPIAAHDHSPQPESPIGGNAFPLRVVEREGALFDVEDRRIAFAADSQRP